MMKRTSISTTIASLCAMLLATPASAQTLDVIQLADGLDLTIARDSANNEQVLLSGGSELLRAPAIIADLLIPRADGQPAGMILYADSSEPGCAPAIYTVTSTFGAPWLRGPVGAPCLTYVAAVHPGGAVLISPPELAMPGDAYIFDLEAGAYRLGPIGYAPQTNRGWDALDGEVGGYSDLSALDLYAANPVYEEMTTLWGDDLFVFAQHLRTRTVPQIEGDFLIQTGCLPSQCAFAIGLLAVDPAQETVYSAFFNEGAPDVRPPLEEWSEGALALFEAWREGAFR